MICLSNLTGDFRNTLMLINSGTPKSGLEEAMSRPARRRTRSDRRPCGGPGADPSGPDQPYFRQTISCYWGVLQPHGTCRNQVRASPSKALGWPTESQSINGRGCWICWGVAGTILGSRWRLGRERREGVRRPWVRFRWRVGCIGKARAASGDVGLAISTALRGLVISMALQVLECRL